MLGIRELAQDRTRQPSSPGPFIQRLIAAQLRVAADESLAYRSELAAERCHVRPTVLMTRPPQFPGYKKCLALMRKHNPQLREDGFHALLPHAADHLAELIREFHTEADHG